jgi:hypothetical protein
MSVMKNKCWINTLKHSLLNYIKYHKDSWIKCFNFQQLMIYLHLVQCRVFAYYLFLKFLHQPSIN